MLLVEKREQIVQQCCEGQDYPSDLLLCSKLPQYWVCENSESDQTQNQTEQKLNLLHSTWYKDKRSSKRSCCLHKLFIWYEWKFNEKLLNLMWCNMLEQSVLEWLEHVVWQWVKILWSQMFVWLWATACSIISHEIETVHIISNRKATWVFCSLCCQREAESIYNGAI